MKKSNLSKRLGEVEQIMVNIHTDAKTEEEYLLWMSENPMNNADGSFYDWMDFMPKQFKPYFTRDVLNLFPHLKQAYRPDKHGLQ